LVKNLANKEDDTAGHARRKSNTPKTSEDITEQIESTNMGMSLYIIPHFSFLLVSLISLIG